MKWLKRFWPSLPTARQVLQAQLAEAERERALAAAARERAVFEERMLNERVSRLQRELAA